MYTAHAQGFWENTYVVERDGKEVAQLHLAMMRARTEVEMGGHHYTFDAEGWFRKRFVATLGSREVLTASKPGALSERVEITVDHRPFAIDKASMWRREFIITQQGMRVGSIRPDGWTHRHAVIETPSEWPLEATVFAFWIVLRQWKEAATAAAAAGGGA